MRTFPNSTSWFGSTAGETPTTPDNFFKVVARQADLKAKASETKMSNPYHIHIKSISRGDGRSATGAAAYRSGSKIVDDRTGLEFDFTKKKGVEHSQIYFPPSEENSRPDLHDRSRLWNEVEKKETKSNAQVAREMEFSFPHQLNAEQRQRMLSMFCNSLAKVHGVVVDASIHAPHGKHADKRNYHAHVMFSTRRFENGQFTEKTREFSKDPYNEKELEKRRAKGLEDFSKRLKGRKNATEMWREAYEKIGNKCLVDAGFEPTLDRRSYEERGIDREPTQHEGAGRAMANRGLQSETHDKNIEITERNKKLSELKNEIVVGSALLNRFDAEYSELRELQTQVQQQFFKNDQMQKRAEKILEMCLLPENFSSTSSLCCELIDHKNDLESKNRFSKEDEIREAIADIALDIINDEIGIIDLSVVERHEMQAFTDHLRKELGNYSKDEMLITYTTENSAKKSAENIVESSVQPTIRQDYNSPEP